jgi:hypothetical protein
VGIKRTKRDVEIMKNFINTYKKIVIIPILVACFVIFLYMRQSGEEKTILWPSLFLGRIGLTYNLWGSVVVFFSGFFVLYKKKCKLHVSVGYLIIYLSLGLYYAKYFPTPKPNFIWRSPEINFSPKEYLIEFEKGYRLGILGNWQECGPMKNEVESMGILDGYSLGASEWENVWPGLTKTELKRIFSHKKHGFAG